MPTATIVLFVVTGSALALAGWYGIEWADLREVSVANALAGRRLYADAGGVRVLAVLALVAGLGLVAWPIIAAFRHK